MTFEGSASLLDPEATVALTVSVNLELGALLTLHASIVDVPGDARLLRAVMAHRLGVS